MALEIEILNHASALVRLGPYVLLSDPWFEQTCFAGGWGLRYANPDAYARAAAATHLWISHWHSDHLHGPTLSKIAARNPDLCVLANVSANFSMVERLASFGFTKVVPVYERRPLALGPDLVVTRYPTAGIDNMLHIAGHGCAVLNYNDCNLPAPALRRIARKLGPLDLLLTNYNHAGKLFERHSPAREKDALFRVLQRTADLLAPRHVVPFASSHYYRNPNSVDQNASLLEFDELAQRARGDERFVVLRPGDRAAFAPGAPPRLELREPKLVAGPADVLRFPSSVGWEELCAAGSKRCGELRRALWLLARALRPLRIEVEDHGRVLELDAKTGVREGAPGEAHIAAHSQALADWLGRRFGDDTFFAGAHFAIRCQDTRVIEAWALATLLEASHLDPRSLLGYLGSRDGLWFLWCRREELLGTLAAGRPRAARIRMEPSLSREG